MEKTSNSVDWIPVVGFYFLVSFQGGIQSDVSFSEISGLEVEMEINSDGQIEKIKHPDLVLKRPMQPLPEVFSKWVNDSINLNTYINTCTINISLLGEGGKIMASWSCSRAYPKKWSLTPFNSEDGNKLVMETLVLNYDELKRMD